ncbi:DNA-directed RNA polymerase subunit alpha [Thermoflexus sp.]|uniref:DNA-directed RNA polymerase subunit alpha n=1 Tax=Thermoflexus sp. TaxID=1969742 RepID=UPI0025FF7E0E|nr:DNA-directed RNA polymerase subunit alpha [Thermoflexus sp.]MDW8180434.1 DNA-directed RNA polymerase subunit alpha [Anaerolineae bacterium]MCS6964953.1 DNA-directed RNA polymerase subunit alpha [Thermoflexus sp.]MCS7350982.1 DNA-directed RNA polymerase subunit alpha [Thermoflexus sp.]MCX7691170.1 DNA-directed RNA polymerase subunit alpha [Thermoflexus sp.]MDW8184248.1 DNA-directed RNA polymerase subunit alpha [Anaerolineae bacterium]
MAGVTLVLPKVEAEILTQSYGRFVISPLEPGYGVTIGNALRRVLLSSLPGAAVTSIRITDVPHEYSTIPGVREDVIQIILNIKQLRMKLYGDGPARLRLEVAGEGVVTAADIQCPPEVEIVNPDLYLFTVDDDRTRLEIEMTVERGRGYSPAEERGRLPIGEIPVDAIFSPVRRCTFEIDRARVGQRTTYDRLVMEIWTDGTMGPKDALIEAARLLLQHFSLISEFVGPEEVEVPPLPVREMIPPQAYETSLESLELSARVINPLRRAGITTVGQVLELFYRGEEALLSVRNFGAKSLEELKERLIERGFLKPEDLPQPAEETEEA